MDSHILPTSCKLILLLLAQNHQKKHSGLTEIRRCKIQAGWLPPHRRAVVEPEFAVVLWRQRFDQCLHFLHTLRRIEISPVRSHVRLVMSRGKGDHDDSPHTGIHRHAAGHHIEGRFADPVAVGSPPGTCRAGGNIDHFLHRREPQVGQQGLGDKYRPQRVHIDASRHLLTCQLGNIVRVLRHQLGSKIPRVVNEDINLLPLQRFRHRRDVFLTGDIQFDDRRSRGFQVSRFLRFARRPDHLVSIGGKLLHHFQAQAPVGTGDQHGDVFFSSILRLQIQRQEDGGGEQ